MPDSYVQVAPDAGGKQIDSQVIGNQAGQTVYRQTIVVADPNNLLSVLGIDPGGMLQNYGQWDRVRSLYATVMAQETTMLRQYGQGNGFNPIETPDFFLGV